MTLNKKILLPIIIIAITAVLTTVIKSNPPESQRGRGSTAPQMTVNVQKLTPQSYDIEIESFGTVRPRTQSALVAQVSGQINEISPRFREGGFFEAGEVLVTLDDRDYQAEQKIAQSTLISAQQGLLEEQARVEQALIDWGRLGNGEEPSALVLRKPQLAAANAQVLSAQAQLQKAELALERSAIKAPYAGRILTKNVDIGQVVTGSTQLADIYAIDYVEIRLPIKNRDLAYMIFPKEYRGQQATVSQSQLGGDVQFTSSMTQKHEWQGQVVRTESAIDSNSQQLYVVAQINDPYSRESAGSTPIKIGQYVSAKIQGKRVDDALIIPNSAIYQGTYVYIVEDGILKRKDIAIAWQNAAVAIVSDGLTFGQSLVTTPLGQVSSGTRVAVAGENASDKSIKKGEGNRKAKTQAKTQGANS